MVKAMVGGCCVCSDERGWDENPLVYCDGHGCSVAVHQGIYYTFLINSVNVSYILICSSCISLLRNRTRPQRTMVLPKVRIARKNSASCK